MHCCLDPMLENGGACRSSLSHSCVSGQSYCRVLCEGEGNLHWPVLVLGSVCGGGN